MIKVSKWYRCPLKLNWWDISVCHIITCLMLFYGWLNWVIGFYEEKLYLWSNHQCQKYDAELGRSLIVIGIQAAAWMTVMFPMKWPSKGLQQGGGVQHQPVIYLYIYIRGFSNPIQLKHSELNDILRCLCVCRTLPRCDCVISDQGYYKIGRPWRPEMLRMSDVWITASMYHSSKECLRIHTWNFNCWNPKNHPIEKANYLPNHKFLGFQPVIFRGVASKIIRSERLQQDGSRPNISIRSKRANGARPCMCCVVWETQIWARQWELDVFKRFRSTKKWGEISWRTKFALEKYDEKFWSQPIFRWPSRDPQTCFCSRVACPIWMVFLLPVLQVDLWISTCSMYCSPRIFSIEGWGGCCLFRGGGVVIVLQGAALPPHPGYWQRRCTRLVFFSLSFSSFVPSGEKWEDGQRRIALTAKVRYMFFLFAMLGFELLDRFLKKFLRKFASFKPTLGRA